MDKILPNNIEVERAVLGACLIGGTQTVKEVNARLGGGVAFYNTHHKLIFRALNECAEEGIPIDILSITNKLSSIGQLEEVGDVVYITGLSSEIATTSFTDYHCDMLVEDYNRRRFIMNQESLIYKAYEKMEGVEDLYAQGRMEIDLDVRDHADTMSSVVSQVADEAELAFENPDSYRGIPTGIPYLDLLLDGWQKEELIVVASRPSVGKTALALWSARHAKGPVYFVSVEMSKRMVGLRLLAAEVRVPSNLLRAGQFSGDEFMRIKDGRERLQALQIYIDDRIRSPDLIVKEAAKMARDYNIRAIFVDYLQLLESPQLAKGSTREREVAAISSAMKHMAKDLGIPTILLCQLNRQVEYSNRRPQKSDLRDSGSIEQDADVIIFLHPVTDTDIVELIVDKNRNGPTGLQRVRYVKETGAFLELTASY